MSIGPVSCYSNLLKWKKPADCGNISCLSVNRQQSHRCDGASCCHCHYAKHERIAPPPTHPKRAILVCVFVLMSLCWLGFTFENELQEGVQGVFRVGAEDWARKTGSDCSESCEACRLDLLTRCLKHLKEKKGESLWVNAENRLSGCKNAVWWRLFGKVTLSSFSTKKWQ